METTQLVYRPKKHGTGPLKHTLQEYKEFIWNPNKFQVLGNDPERLGKLLLFYIIFYGGLLIIFAILMAFFLYVVIDANHPQLTGMDNLIKGNPGLALRPQHDLRSTMIRFEQGFPSSYKIHIDHMQAFLDLYENDMQVGEHFIDCSTSADGRRGEDQRDSVCRFDIDLLGADCTWQKDYGFDEGHPCVLLKFNAVYDWEPIDFDEDDIPQELLDSGRYQPGHIGVTCEGETPMDEGNIGEVLYHPPQGFPFYFFPYTNQEGYRQPVMMVEFLAPANGVVINVHCKAWARNLYHHREDAAAMVHFELLVD